MDESVDETPHTRLGIEPHGRYYPTPIGYLDRPSSGATTPFGAHVSDRCSRTMAPTRRTELRSRSMRRLLVLSLLVGLTACKKSKDTEKTTAPPKAVAARAAPAPSDVFTRIWEGTLESKYGCDDYDYFPDGGMRNLACHLQTVVPYTELLAAAGGVWAKGPHGTQRLRLDAEDGFGHYDPKFVDFLADNAVIGARSGKIKAATQPIYDQVFSNLAKIYLRAKIQLERDPDLMQRERAYLLAHLESPKEQRPIDRLREYEPEDAYNLYGPALAFWIRRDVDGTADKFEVGLRRLLKAYEPAAIRAIEKMELAKTEPIVAPGEAAPSPATGVPDGPIDTMIAAAWRQVGTSPFACPDKFEYKPGGMQMAYCYVRGLIDYPVFKAKLPTRIFESGPHGEGLDLGNEKSFGHYDPKFVTWFVEHAIPANRDGALRAATQAAYDDRFRIAARAFYAAHLRLKDDANFRAAEKKKYEAYIESGGQPPFWTYWEKMPGDYSAQAIAGTGVAFWLRRQMDGTDAEFLRGLEKLLSTYDAEFLGWAKQVGFDGLFKGPEYFADPPPENEGP